METDAMSAVLKGTVLDVKSTELIVRSYSFINQREQT